jgi:hypothetical protein
MSPIFEHADARGSGRASFGNLALPILDSAVRLPRFVVGHRFDKAVIGEPNADPGKLFGLPDAVCRNSDI